MKTLILLRHAKSEHPTGVADFDRSLNERGKRDAVRVGEVLLERGLTPDIIVSSSARRAHRTAVRAAKSCGFKSDILETEDLYEADPWDIVTVIQQFPEEATTALVVGHNPGFWSLVQTLGGAIEQFPTAAWAHIRLPVEFWAEITEMTRGRIVELWYPKAEK
jgi:phosphohistidine phosphatase